MSASLYLTIMIGVIAASVALSLPSLFLKKCPRCGVRNGLDAKACRRCKTPFAEDPET